MSHVNRITSSVIDSAIEVHRELGPGLLESTYQACLAWELRDRGHRVASEVSVPIRYKGEFVRAGYRMDLLVDHLVVVELKVVQKIIPIHRSQVLSYLRLARRPVGLLINFNVPRLTDGVRRIVLGYHGPRPGEDPELG